MKNDILGIITAQKNDQREKKIRNVGILTSTQNDLFKKLTGKTKNI